MCMRSLGAHCLLLQAKKEAAAAQEEVSDAVMQSCSHAVMLSCCHAVTHTHNADMLSHRRRPRRRAASRSRATTTGWVQPAVIAVIKHSSIIHSCPVAGRDHRAAPADQAAAQRGHQRTPAAGRRPDGACERDQGAAGALQGKMRTVMSCLHSSHRARAVPPCSAAGGC